VGADGKVLPINQAIQAQHGDSLLTLELNRFNLEYNLAPSFSASAPFSELQVQLDSALARLRQTAAQQQAQIVPIGILPTARVDDFGLHTMTDLPRYHALTRGLKRLGSGSFKIHINGEPPLIMQRNDVTMEGANTSFQFHYRVNNRHFADTFNAFSLATPIVTALAANSPTLFGHRLWHETRVPLFKHSIDSRLDKQHWRQPARVSFGQGWVRRSAFELFAETAAIHPPLLPVCSDTDYQRQIDAGSAPGLDELRMHQNATWPWLRPVYDPGDGGHLRIELRALPAGPSTVDMLANAALYVGLAEGLRPHLEQLLPAMPFAYAKYNFYRAAQFGLGAQLLWPDLHRHHLQEIALPELARQLMPVAREGLRAIGIDAQEADKWLDVIAARLDARRSGASWQLDCLDTFTRGGMKPMPAAQQMLQHYIAQSQSGASIAAWTLP
jgi:gamma-glutamyl:cysteine ligase YbdK (ATP-grasp superfamily)